MTEALNQIDILKTPLDEVHLSLGASMQAHDGWSVPASYGDVLFEYAAVRESGAGLLDLSSRGRLFVSGTEAVPFLNGLITNDMKTLKEGNWMLAALPNVQGRLIASVRVVHCRDGFLLDTEAVTHERLLKTIDRFTLAGDFRVADLTERTALLSVQGKQAAAIMQSVLGQAAAALLKNGALQINWQQAEATIIHNTHTGEDGFDVIVDRDQAGPLWQALMRAGARPFGYDAFDTLRIEAGVPRYGPDMDESVVVTEANLDEAVSYTKGCYIGQEIIARIKYRGHVAKKLTGVIFEQALNPLNDAKIRSGDNKEIGRLTSVTYSPHLGSTIALAYVKYDYLASGTGVKVSSHDEEFAAEVTELPFVRGSWYESRPAEAQA